MFDAENLDVLIAGAGPVGQLAALAMANQDLKVQILDTGIWPTTHSYALALHPQSIELLKKFGLADAIKERSYPVRSMGIYDRNGGVATLRLDMGNPDGQLAVVRQDGLEEVLETALKERGVKIQWRHELARVEESAGAVTATINRLERQSRGYIVAHSEWVVAKSKDVRVPFVVGADGHSSRVRRAANLDFPEVGTAQYFAVFEFEAAADPHHEMALALGERTTDVLWPLPGGKYRWSFQLPNYHDRAAEQIKDSILNTGFGYVPTERPKDRSMAESDDYTAALSEESLARMIAERAPWFKTTIDRITWRTLVRFERRLASRFGQGRLWLAGDSAHLTGPVGIQSMNLGLMEANDLAGVLQGILKHRKPIATLEDYNTRWTVIWRQLLGLDTKLRPGVQADSRVAAKVDDLLSCLPAYGPELTALAGQLGLGF